MKQKYIDQNITETLESNYMPYAMSVIVSRALPEIDGFKPAHRKLLYTMYKMGLLTGARTKSANIVGQTMRLNPHGDGPIYETMVRLSRGNEALNIPFIDSKGNFGKVYSRDMAYAASRYTEAKLDSFCTELFGDIDKDSVDFVPNYDNTMKEPTLLPTSFPNILVNPNLGIAVGMASNICSFNLEEVCRTTIELLKNPDHDILSTLKAPDFSTGAEILWNRNQLEDIYATGRGSIRLRAKWQYLKKENIIEITQIPYTTTVEAIIDKVTELIKAGKIREINDMRDETGLNGLKIAIDLKRGIDPDQLMLKLMKMTPLMDSFSCNFNVLVAGTPKVMGIREILNEWSAFRIECVRRAMFFDLSRKREKLHLLKGLKKILLDIDKAIKIIRETEEDALVVPNLMIGFGIDKLQAEYVAEIKLRNINKQYILSRIADVDDLEKEIADLEATVNDIKKVKKIIIKQLEHIIKKYPSPRKTEIVLDHEVEEYNAEENIEDYPVNVFVTKEGYFKKITPLSLRMGGEHKLKEGDEIFQSFETTNKTDIIFLTNSGQAYKAKLHEFDDTKASVLGDYIPAKLGMDAGENVVFTFITKDYKGELLYFFENGKAAKIPVSGFETKTNRKKLTGAYSTASPLVSALHIMEDTNVFIETSGSRGLCVNSVLIPLKATKTTIGVNTVSLKKNQKVTSVCAAEKSVYKNLTRYTSRTIPAAGAILRDENPQEVQMTLE